MIIATSCICCDGRRLLKSPAVLMPFVAKRVFDWDPVEITLDWGLRTVSPGMAYTLCNTLQCEDCEVLFLDMRFSDAEMDRLYSGYRGAAYTSLRERFEPGYAARNTLLMVRAAYLPLIEAMIAPYLSWPLRILDWGGDTGLNTPFRDSAESIHLYDISGLDLAEGVTAVLRRDLADVTFNLVVCSNVLEHVSAPSSLLGEITAVMGPETLLYLEVPLEAYVAENAGSKTLVSGKKHWHEHINFFTEASLRALIGLRGLNILHFETMETDIYGRPGRQYCILCARA